MQKRLVRVGTSLALVIDKAVLRLWNVTRMSRLSVEMEGGRLVVTPVSGSGDPRPPSRREALQVVHELERLGFGQAHFDQLAAQPMQLGRYVMRLDGARDVSPDVAVTMCRMAALRRLLREGWKQRHAFAAAIAAHPHEQPSGVETRLNEVDAGISAAEDFARGEIELARQEAQFAKAEREAQRLAQEARDRWA